MAEYQARLIHEHDLPSLKAGFHKIFGYYINSPAAPGAADARRLSRSRPRTPSVTSPPELHGFGSVITAEARALQREQASSTISAACGRRPLHPSSSPAYALRLTAVSLLRR